MHLLKNFWTLGIVVLNLTGCGITDYPTVTLLSQVQTDSCWLTCAHMQIYTLKKKLKEREINWKLGWFKNSTVPLIKGIYLDQKVFLLHKPVVNMDHNSQWQISKKYIEHKLWNTVPVQLCNPITMTAGDAVLKKKKNRRHTVLVAQKGSRMHINGQMVSLPLKCLVF